jgi:RimJ/RimL family protein N-acetyltransferase
LKEEGAIGPIRQISLIGPIILRPSLPHEAELFAKWEQDPDTAPHILPYSPDQHLSEMAKANVRHLALLAPPGQHPVGFMILIPDGPVLGLKRWVIGPKGRGYGLPSLRALRLYAVQNGFTCLWLDVLADNKRARHVYEKAGFRVVDVLDFFGRPLLIYESCLMVGGGKEKERGRETFAPGNCPI